MPGTIKAKSKDLTELLPFLAPPVVLKDLVVFTRQFATMIDAGLPLVQCLEIPGTQQENATFKKKILEIKHDVEGGSTFSEALGKHPKIFDSLYVNLVAAGEVGGILDTILNRLAKYMEKAAALKRKVKGAMVYPISVTVIASMVVVVMLVKVIPVFEKMFADFGGALPGPTAKVIAISHFMQAYYLHFAGGIVLAVFAYKFITSKPKGRLFFDTVFLKTPVFGGLLKKVAVARFSRTLSTMLSSGVPILDALEIVARTAGNMVVENEILRTKASIAEGKTIAEPARRQLSFAPLPAREARSELRLSAWVGRPGDGMRHSRSAKRHNGQLRELRLATVQHPLSEAAPSGLIGPCPRVGRQEAPARALLLSEAQPKHE